MSPLFLPFGGLSEEIVSRAQVASKGKCLSHALGHTLVVLEVL